MKKRQLSSMAMAALLSLSVSVSFAASDKAAGGNSGLKSQGPARAASPHLEAKREMVRKQQAQRITQEQRKTAAKNLQEQRKKVYAAKQAVKKAKQQGAESK